jgi:hypothetical protein
MDFVIIHSKIKLNMTTKMIKLKNFEEYLVVFPAETQKIQSQ